MSRSALLLRAVNVGGRSRVPMAELREVLRPLLGPVTTYIASGNIVCEHPSDPAAACGQARALISDAFGVDTPVILRTHDALVATLQALPFPEASDTATHVMFLAGRADARSRDCVRRSGSLLSETTSGSTTAQAGCGVRSSRRPCWTVPSASPARRGTCGRCVRSRS